MTRMQSATKGGSVKLMDGTFYSRKWNPVFTPVDNREQVRFIQLVEDAEEDEGRPLTDNELVEIADDIYRGVAL